MTCNGMHMYQLTRWGRAPEALRGLSQIRGSRYRIPFFFYTTSLCCVGVRFSRKWGGGTKHSSSSSNQGYRLVSPHQRGIFPSASFCIGTRGG